MQPENKSIHEEISLLDIILNLVKNKKIIYRTTLVFFIIGFFIALIRQSNYTSTSIVVTENLTTDQLGAIASGLTSLRQFGINIGGAEEGITIEAYPELIMSNEVLYATIQDTFYFSDMDSSLRFVDYASQKNIWYYFKKYTIGLPRLIIRSILPPPEKNLEKIGNDILVISDNEYEAINEISGEMLTVDADIETGLIKITTATSDPLLSAELNRSILKNFKNRMQYLYDLKTSENLKFIKARFNEAKKSLHDAEDKVVKFLEQNSNPSTIELQTQLERLKRDVSFKSELYSELLSQLTQTELDLKRKEPVIRIMERPAPPTEPSGVGRLVIIIAFIVFGAIIGVSLAFIKIFTTNINNTLENREKIEELKSLLPEIDRIKKLFKIKKTTS